jgi:hypothetical protein
MRWDSFVKILVAGVLLALVVTWGCTRPPSVETAATPEWSVDTTRDWTERLHCPDATGYVVLQSQGDMRTYERYDSVVYVLERRGRYWIGQRINGADVVSDPSVRAWSIRAARCDGMGGER